MEDRQRGERGDLGGERAGAGREHNQQEGLGHGRAAAHSDQASVRQEPVAPQAGPLRLSAHAPHLDS
jgi:hypothetical protein